MKAWKILVAGPAGYEREERFCGETLDEALDELRKAGFACVSDEDGNPITREVLVS